MPTQRSPRLYRLTLLTSFTLVHDATVVDRFASRQEDRLLAYLALEPGVARSRDAIVATFWPHLETSKARKLLSLYLFKLKDRLARSGLEGAIEDTRETLRLAPDIRTDAQEFAELVLAGSLAQSPVDKARHLQAAVELYGVGLLPSYGFPWVAEERARYEVLYRQAANRLAELLDPSGSMRDLFRAMPATAWKGLARLEDRETPPGEAAPDPPDAGTIALGAQAPPAARTRSTASPTAPALIPDVPALETLVREAEPVLNGPERAVAIRQLSARLTEIRTLLAQPPTVASFRGQLFIAAALWRYWYATGRVPEGRSYVEELLAAGLDAPPNVRAGALHAAGTLANLEGDRAVGIARLKEAADLWHDLGDEGALLRTVVNLALARHDAGEFEEARALHAQAIRVARRLGQESSLSRALFNGALTELKLGDSRAARALLEERLALPIADHDATLRGVTYAHLASAALLEDDMEAARNAARAAIDAFTFAPDPRGQAIAECVMGRIHFLEGRLDEARDALLESVRHARAASDMGLTGMALGYLALAYERRGEADMAAQCTLNATVLMRSASADDALARFEAEMGEAKAAPELAAGPAAEGIAP